jgi:GTP cyclohydrolase I
MYDGDFILICMRNLTGYSKFIRIVLRYSTPFTSYETLQRRMAEQALQSLQAIEIQFRVTVYG